MDGFVWKLGLVITSGFSFSSLLPNPLTSDPIAINVGTSITPLV